MAAPSVLWFLCFVVQSVTPSPIIRQAMNENTTTEDNNRNGGGGLESDVIAAIAGVVVSFVIGFAIISFTVYLHCAKEVETIAGHGVGVNCVIGNDNFFLTCNAKNVLPHDGIQFEWKKYIDGSYSTITGEEIKQQNHRKTSTLKFQPLAKNHEGTYLCEYARKRRVCCGCLRKMKIDHSEPVSVNPITAPPEPLPLQPESPGQEESRISDPLTELVNEYEEVDRAFGVLVYKMGEHLHEKEINIQALQNLLQYSQLYKPLLTLFETADIHDLFAKTLCNHYSWFDYELIQYVIQGFGDENLKGHMSEYLTLFKKFCERKVSQILSTKLCQSNEKGYELHIYLKIAKRMEEVSVAEIKKIEEKFQKMVDTRIWLETIQNGSVILVFVSLEKIVTLSKEHKCQLLNLGVTKVYSEESILFDEADAAEELDKLGRKRSGTVVMAIPTPLVITMGDMVDATNLEARVIEMVEEPYTSDARLSLSDIPRLMEILKDAAPKWREIGNRLGFSSAQLGNIEGGSSLHQLEEMLAMWLQCPGTPTLATLAHALEYAGLLEIRNHFFELF